MDYVFVGVVLIICGIVVLVTPWLLATLGFTTAGVAAGSFAAAFQSFFYGGAVPAGSAFAAAQSAGATGFGAGALKACAAAACFKAAF
ncbi:hypothetical protein MNV49_006329 [Pseudohyphozyma bogoriensis]|nr:hypothetical protein MNV49_006329 [Pseudohyphozyma bogoriensis]